ncbi:MAG: hypothetical protein DDT34_02318 [Firmicutes bacterium]|nr:hypothetical protein [Bacillota bacterium]
MGAYITVVELDVLVSQLYTADELDEVGWGAMSAGDKQIHLNRATNIIDSLNFNGVKAVAGESLAFPRVINGRNIGIPECVKKAVASTVIYELKAKSNVNIQLQRQGVKQVSASKASVTFGDSSAHTAALGIEARKFLKPYLITWISR